MKNNGQDSEKRNEKRGEADGKLRPGAGLKAYPVNRHRLLGTVLLFVVLEIAVLSVERAQWITPQPLLTLVLIISMLVTWSTGSIRRIPGALSHAVIIITGLLVTLWQATAVSDFSQGTIYFVIFLVLLVWITGYLSTWYFLKKQNAWVAVILGAVIVLVNLSNLPDEYYYFFGIYFVVAIIFVAQNRISGQDQREGDHASRKSGLRYFMAVLVGVCILAVSVSWVTPVLRTPGLETWVATKNLWTNDLKESGFNFFAYVMAKQPKATSSARRFLGFGESWHEKDDVHFIVHSERPAYWQVYIYDEYISRGWMNSQLNQHMVDGNVPWEYTEPYLKQNKIANKVETGLKTDIILTAGEFSSADTPVFVHENNGEVIAVTMPRLLKPGESYEITSYISSATAGELSEAGEDYPQSITDTYLQLPDAFPGSIRAISAAIAGDAATPYDRVKAIDEYLSGFTYVEELEPPPADIDGVEYFLTVRKSGFCMYFASAMAVMLRSVDVPARLAVGYLPGETGENAGEYIVRDRHYHAWTQVYFPEYGWINVEATPSPADSPVAVEAPAVSSYDTRTGTTTSPYDWWLYWQNEQMVQPGDIPANIPAPEFQWPFANALGSILSIIFFIALFGLLAIAVLLVLRSRFNRWLWEVTRKDTAKNIYSRLCSLGALAKFGPTPQQTPLEYSAVLASEFPAHAGAISDITRAYVDNQFGGKDSTLGLMEEATLLRSRREAFNAILKRVGFFNKVLRRPL